MKVNKNFAMGAALLLGSFFAGNIAAAAPSAADYEKAAAVYKINESVERVIEGDRVRFVDHNPTRYSKRTLGGHVVEGWVKDGVVYTKVNDNEPRSYKINESVERIIEGDRVRFIDHNPAKYSKRTLGGHAVESWIEDGVVYQKNK